MKTTLLLTALVGAAFLIPSALVAQDHDHHRYYDRGHKDYHEWNNHEDRAWHMYWEQQHRPYVEWHGARERDRERYWAWRHRHSDAFLKIDIR